MNASRTPAPSKLFPCWICGAVKITRPRYRCRASPCEGIYLRTYGRGGRPDADETSIYLERKLAAENEAVRGARRDRIVKSYAEGILAYREARDSLLEIGCTETVLGAERMIHRTLHFLGLEGQGNKRVSL